MKVLWNDIIIAESDNVKTLEGNYYFPIDSVNKNYLQESHHTSTCPWKGVANHFDLVVKNNINKNAAWYYADPSEQAIEIKNHIAFWKGVEFKD